MSEKSLEKRILTRMIDQLNIDDVDITDYDYKTPIFAEDEEDIAGLGLDSIDALELAVALHEEFGIKVEIKDIKELRTVKDIADFVRKEGTDAI